MVIILPTSHKVSNMVFTSHISAISTNVLAVASPRIITLKILTTKYMKIEDHMSALMM